MNISSEKIIEFQKFIWQFYRDNGRPFAWRNIDDPYRVVVSEIMLQQTQTYRVEPKYDNFISMFPDWNSLACVGLRDVLCAWQGLGYNRRGGYLHQIAQKVMQEYAGNLPQDPEVLESFPGIGKATAASICAFAFNKPVVFIETNIRAVFIDSFFRERDKVQDKEIFPLIKSALDYHNSREWYYALMDYGVYLKKNRVNPSRKSAHHVKQSKFEGSDRQIRGAIIRLLTQHEHLTQEQIVIFLSNSMQNSDTQRIEKIIHKVCHDGLVKKRNNCFSIS